MWFFYSLFTVIGYLPWLGIAINQIRTVNEHYWITLPESRLSVLRELLYTSIPYTEKFFLLIFIAITIFGIALLIYKKSFKEYWVLSCLLPLWIILFLGIWYGEYIRPLLVSRYLIMPVCLLILGGSIAINYTPKFITITTFILIFFIGTIWFKDNYQNLYYSKRKIQFHSFKVK